MNTKEKFKDFVKNHPELLKHIKDKSKTWQDFYEIYDMYGEDEQVWRDFIKTSTTLPSFDLMGFLKNIDLENIQEGVNSVQRVLGLLQDIKPNNENNIIRKPRPLYRHFDD